MITLCCICVCACAPSALWLRPGRPGRNRPLSGGYREPQRPRCSLYLAAWSAPLRGGALATTRCALGATHELEVATAHTVCLSCRRPTRALWLCRAGGTSRVTSRQRTCLESISLHLLHGGRRSAPVAGLRWDIAPRTSPSVLHSSSAVELREHSGCEAVYL